MRRRVGWVLPTQWDRRQLDACRAAWESRLECEFLGPEDADVPWDMDVAAWLAQAERDAAGLDGLASSSDYPGAVLAAELARRLHLPGADPRRVLAVGHKGEARALQARAAPQAVPRCWALDPTRPRDVPEDLPFPCFVKPARGSFSLLSRALPDASTLRDYLATPAVAVHHAQYAEIHRRLAALLGHAGADPGAFLAEDLLRGAQVTLEGWVCRGRVGVLGIVDSHVHAGTHAFACFETPSALPESVQARMAGIAARVVPALGLDHGCFNVEFFWDAERDRVHVIEVNPRLAGQFGDLWQKTTTRSSYAVALALALGEDPPPPRGWPSWPFAASVPLRTFQPAVVERAPAPERIREVESAFPGTLVWWECREGERLEGFDAAGEGQGYRYAVLNVGASTRAGLLARARSVQAALGARLVPLVP